MKKKFLTKCLAAVLTLSLSVGMAIPTTAYATEIEETEAGEAAVKSTKEAETTETKLSDYSKFVECLKVLESYADSYASKKSGEDVVDLVINYIRTGVDRYNTDNWVTMAGAEKTEFTAYVAEQDEVNGTEASALRNLDEFKIPNGQTVEFEHMFGTLDISYGSIAARADFGGWAGDLCDLLQYSKKSGVTGDDIDAKADYIRTELLGDDVDEEDSFGFLDIYADLDAY